MAHIHAARGHGGRVAAIYGPALQGHSDWQVLGSSCGCPETFAARVSCCSCTIS